ncbi:MAG: phosphoenolpyruvate synthase PpsA, partial [Desulfobacterales bacterium]|nr:phosphoenolpyruvate synthase PpsA [Desulfobacterales bacterium]
MVQTQSAPRGVSIKIYHELMAQKVERILLVSSPYDAFIMEEEGRLSTRIINEYKGLNLSKPPRLTWISSAESALEKLKTTPFDMVIAMPSMEGMDIQSFGMAVKDNQPDLPLFMLLHNTCDQDQNVCIDPGNAIDRVYMWRGNADLLLAMIKNLEDEMNVAFDTENAQVRLIILVEDSPQYYSTLLPVIYRQIVLQTQKVIEESINEEHRLLKMRGRTKVLLAHNYEEALALFDQYREYVLSVFSDMRYPKEGKADKLAGYKLLKQIKSKAPDLPVLVLSTEEQEPEIINEIPAVFIHKNATNLNDRIKSFFIDHLGFGDFVFRSPEGEEIARAANLEDIERLVSEIPDDAVMAHAHNNDFSRWLMARSEIDFALKLKPYGVDDFSDATAMKRFLIDSIREKRRGTRRGQIIDFDTARFDTDTDFMKIGSGSLGGKARGLAFLASQMGKDPCLQDQFPDVEISIPQTLIIATDGFKTFVEDNRLYQLLEQGPELTDQDVVEAFMEARFPPELKKRLKSYLEQVRYPIAVRSSSLFEDAHYQPFAGLYHTYMLPNSHPNVDIRLHQLILAIKRVYASTYTAAPRAYAKNTQHRTEDEEMALVLQQLTGIKYKNYF